MTTEKENLINKLNKDFNSKFLEDLFDGMNEQELIGVRKLAMKYIYKIRYKEIKDGYHTWNKYKIEHTNEKN